MTTDQYIAKMRKKLADLKEGKPVQIAAQDTHVQMAERIFDKHKNETGGKIGEYNSKDPLYVNPKNSPKKFPTKGKEGKAKFKNGNDHKTGYFDSYKDYRSTIGRQTGEVDLKLFGRLQSDFSKGVVKQSALKYTSTVNQDNKDKIDGAVEKYGNIFDLSKEENQNFIDVLEFESIKILK